MAQETLNGADQGVGPLIRGIVGDVQTLVGQQVDLLKTEVLVDFRKTRDAAMVLGIGLTVSFVGALLLCIGLAEFLHWTTLEVREPAALPRWACYGLIGLLIGGVGSYLLYVAREKFASFNPLPEKAAEAIKETLEWKTTTSPK
jgi:xanthosine utilization system XapX-like protein